MKMMKTACAAAVATTMAAEVSAATLHEVYAGDYLATAAFSEQANIPVSLWFEQAMAPGWALDYVIEAPGQFSMTSVGTATLTARAYSVSNGNSGFDLSFSFDQDYSDGPTGTPTFKALFGAIEPDNNFFLDVAYGALSGFGDLAGLELEANRFPDPEGAATQVGGGLTDIRGSNLHNANFGLSNWFQVTGVLDASCLVCTTSTAQSLIGIQGDIVLDLVPAPVPLPAGILLLGTALAGIVGLRRRRKS